MKNGKTMYVLKGCRLSNLPVERIKNGKDALRRGESGARAYRRRQCIATVLWMRGRY
jgi:hypothetical protein